MQSQYILTEVTCTKIAKLNEKQQTVSNRIPKPHPTSIALLLHVSYVSNHNYLTMLLSNRALWQFIVHLSMVSSFCDTLTAYLSIGLSGSAPFRLNIFHSFLVSKLTDIIEEHLATING